MGKMFRHPLYFNKYSQFKRYYRRALKQLDHYFTPSPGPFSALYCLSKDMTLISQCDPIFSCETCDQWRHALAIKFYWNYSPKMTFPKDNDNNGLQPTDIVIQTHPSLKYELKVPTVQIQGPTEILPKHVYFPSHLDCGDGLTPLPPNYCTAPHKWAPIYHPCHDRQIALHPYKITLHTCPNPYFNVDTYHSIPYQDMAGKLIRHYSNTPQVDFPFPKDIFWYMQDRYRQQTGQMRSLKQQCIRAIIKKVIRRIRKHFVFYDYYTPTDFPQFFNN